MTYLSGKLIQWQDFNEIQTDLGYELAKELDSLESIEARINSGDTNLKAGQHDLKVHLIEIKCEAEYISCILCVYV